MAIELGNKSGLATRKRKLRCRVGYVRTRRVGALEKESD